jgi:hypothetical protein
MDASGPVVAVGAEDSAGVPLLGVVVVAEVAVALPPFPAEPARQPVRESAAAAVAARKKFACAGRIRVPFKRCHRSLGEYAGPSVPQYLWDLLRRGEVVKLRVAQQK